MADCFTTLKSRGTTSKVTIAERIRPPSRKALDIFLVLLFCSPIPNFGGGKTHSMLALYHLFSGVPPGELPGVDAVLAETGVKGPPKATRVVLVGNKISPGNPVKKPDGTIVRTLWGELAYQLGGRKAFARVQADDEKATSPGDVLRELFKEYGPALS